MNKLKAGFPPKSLTAVTPTKQATADCKMGKTSKLQKAKESWTK